MEEVRTSAAWKCKQLWNFFSWYLFLRMSFEHRPWDLCIQIICNSLSSFVSLSLDSVHCLATGLQFTTLGSCISDHKKFCCSDFCLYGKQERIQLNANHPLAESMVYSAIWRDVDILLWPWCDLDLDVWTWPYYTQKNNVLKISKIWHQIGKEVDIFTLTLMWPSPWFVTLTSLMTCNHI